MTWIAALLAVFTSSLGNAAAMTTATVQPLPVDALLNREMILGAELAADGEWVAIVTARVGAPVDEDGPAAANVMTSGVQVVSADRGEVIKLTPTGAESNFGKWSPDGRTLAYDVETRDGRTLWLWDSLRKRARQLSDVQLRHGNATWGPDGKFIVVAALPEGETQRSIERRERPASRLSSQETYKSALVPGATVVTYSAGDVMARGAPADQDYALNERFRADVARIDVSTGALTWLARGYRPQSLHCSPDGRSVAFATATGQRRGEGFRNTFDVMAMPVDGAAAPRTIVQGIESIRTVLDFSWSPDGTRLAFNNSHLGEQADAGTANDSYVVDIDTGSLRPVRLLDAGDEQGFSVSPYRTPLWSASGDAIYLLGTRGLWRVDAATLSARLFSSIAGKSIRQILVPKARDRLDAGRRGTLLVVARDEQTLSEGIHEIDLATGKARQLLEQPARLGSAPAKLDMAMNHDVIVYARETASSPEQLWISDAGLHRPRVLTDLNAHLSAFEFGRSRLLTWRSEDGRPMRGALLLPAGYREGQRYPLIVTAYPNDRLSEGLNLFGGSGGFATPLQNSQLLATRGFAVLEADSATSADSAMRDIRASVLPGVDAAIALGVADPERIGVKGQSHGGYAALALIVQTQRFKAAVVSSGFSNLTSFYGQMLADGTHWSMSWLERAENMASTPWEQRDRYIDNSPYFLLDKVVTPVLLIHGTADTAVSAHLSDETFVSLRRLGKTVTYAKYVNEGHVILGRANAADAAERMLQWFQQYLADPERTTRL